MLASFDIGIKNFAVCVMDASMYIQEWKVIDISSHLKKQSLNLIADKIYQELDTMKSMWSDVEIVLIENQPVLKNPTMKSIQMLVYGYFQWYKMNGTLKQIILLSAKSKLKVKNAIICTRYKSGYKNNKESAIMTAQMYLKNHEKLYILNESLKKDDLSDCFLQCVHYLQK